MKKQLVYDAVDALKFIKKKYPLIPMWVIRRILYANDLYYKKIGIIDWSPKLSDWTYTKKK